MRQPVQRAYPNGWCWCGCGTPVGDRVKFAPGGHDATARSMILDQFYEGDTATMVLAHLHAEPGPGGFGIDRARYVQDEELVRSLAERIKVVRTRPGWSRRRLQQLTGIRGHNTVWRVEVQHKLLPEEREPLEAGLARAEASFRN